MKIAVIAACGLALAGCITPPKRMEVQHLGATTFRFTTQLSAEEFASPGVGNEVARRVGWESVRSGACPAKLYAKVLDVDFDHLGDGRVDVHVLVRCQFNQWY
jgi:hypothetical protein